MKMMADATVPAALSSAGVSARDLDDPAMMGDARRGLAAAASGIGSSEARTRARPPQSN